MFSDRGRKLIQSEVIKNNFILKLSWINRNILMTVNNLILICTAVDIRLPECSSVGIIEAVPNGPVSVSTQEDGHS